MSATEDPRELRETEAKAQDAWAEAMDHAWRKTDEHSGARGRLGAVGDRLRGISGRFLRRGPRGGEGDAVGGTSGGATGLDQGRLDQATRQELEARARKLGIKDAGHMSEAELAREIARRF